MNFNKVIVGGNLTRDPEMKYLANDRALCKFGLALNRKWGDKEEVTFLDIEAWGKTAELVGQYLNKGSQALIEGRLRQDTWEAQDGSKRSRMMIVADSVHFVGGKAATSPERTTAPPEPRPADHSITDDDMPPF